MQTLKTLTASIPDFEVFKTLKEFSDYCDDNNIKPNNKLRSEVEMLYKVFKQSNIKVTGIILSKDKSYAYIETDERISDPIPLQTLGQAITKLNEKSYLEVKNKKYTFRLGIK